jgi:hypothetical protein
MESCTILTYDPSVEADPELEVEDAVRFPPGGVNLPVEALTPPPPPVALIRDFGRDIIAAYVVKNREWVRSKGC